MKLRKIRRWLRRLFWHEPLHVDEVVDEVVDDGREYKDNDDLPSFTYGTNPFYTEDTKD